MKWLNFDTLKNASFYFTPNLPVIATKRYKFSLFRGLGILALYTLASWLVLILILSITPLKDTLFVVDNSELIAQRQKIEKLQNRVILLTQQLQEIASVNERMKYAIKLAEKDTIDPKNPLYDTLRKTIKKKIKVEGNILEVLVDWFNKYFHDGKEKIIFYEPLQGIITQSFDPSKGHFGVDYGVKKNTPVFATAGGIVIFSDYTIDYGYTLIIQHNENYISIYKHCESLLKRERDIVTQGELIALSGNTGTKTSGPHLHFEIWQNGKPINPENLFIK